MQWKLESMCDDCPFATSGKGLYLRKSLGKGRWKEILDSLHHSCFPCHKTSTETGNGKNIVCAGAYAYQVKHDLWPQYRQVMERITEMKKRGLYGRTKKNVRPTIDKTTRTEDHRL